MADYYQLGCLGYDLEAPADHEAPRWLFFDTLRLMNLLYLGAIFLFAMFKNVEKFEFEKTF